jgi:hypothetical protein
VAVDLVRAFEDWDYRESLVGLDDPLVTLLRRAGAFAYDAHETVDFTDWNGAVVGRGAGSVIRAAIPLDPTLPFSEFEFLLESGPRARRVVATHPSTPLATLLALAEDADFEVQLALLKNQRSDLQAVFERLCRSTFRPVREAIATDARLAPHLVEILLADPVPEVRTRVLWRKDLDAATLGRILESEPGRGEAIAAHPNVTPELLLLLAASKSVTARLAVASNPRAPSGALELIAKQEQNSRIRRALASHAATPSSLLSRLVEEPSLQLVLAGRRDLAGEAQLVCAASSSLEVRTAVAKNGTEQRALRLLVVDSSASVRAALATNPHWHGLEDLALDAMSPVRRNVARRADCPRELLELLAADSQSEVANAAQKTLAAAAKKAPD